MDLIVNKNSLSMLIGDLILSFKDAGDKHAYRIIQVQQVIDALTDEVKALRFTFYIVVLIVYLRLSI